MSRKHKDFYVVTYDISLTRTRNRVSIILEKYGHRVNKSVFECMVTQSQAYRMKNEISEIITKKTDSVIFYPLCQDCFSKIEYNQTEHPRASIVKIIA